jgi:hypothetical protein
MIQTIIFSTLGQLATGILAFIALVPPSRIGQTFARFHTGLALALWLIAVRASVSPAFLILAASLVLAFLLAGKERLYYLFLTVAFLLSLSLLVHDDAARFGWPSALLIHIPAVLVLGGSSVAMLLGHWYLVAPKLSISYLKVVTIGLISSIVVRSVLLTWVVVQNNTRLSEMHFYEIYGIFFLQRIALGLILTLVLSVLTFFCVRIRSTQSATGILYVVLVFCLVGELIAAYLFARTGISF